MKYKYWKWIFTGTCLLIAILVLFKVKAILGPFFLAFVLAFLLNPFVEGLERYRISRNKSIAIVFTIIIAILATAIFFILPIIYNELSKLVVVLPKTIESITVMIDGFREQFKATGLPSRVAQVLDQQLAQSEIIIADRLNLFLASLPNVLSTFTLYMLSPVIAIYFLADWKGLGNGFFRIIPQRWRMEWRRLWQDINHVIRQFIRGDLVVAVIVGILIGIGVKLVGMEYALLIGLICGIFDLIPYFGPVIGAVPAVLLALTQSPAMAVKVTLIIFIVQQLEGNIISPKLMGESVGLHPLWVVFALLACGEIAGFWGMFLAVPLAAVVRVILNHVYFRLVSTKV
ncbi:AI-2E family transporter [Desulfosporosinus sp. BICA1-9]|uniref:AI-2E family transporter n=1 Tax=Desulfosporosinus sp. BICA1-9 TaxID=1531958 RepID=UPI00054C07EA|nr:AI-2E family transporter [Desulfosporosinus sp. BICA1-9]KJS48514.1 MAG: permease [Peptococcaceae bacterium BRH_c23]KJS77932.1 MAG: permease [Desulfosporosinus sp. BICA1-9]HBW36296.1 AI-2E family transporter [Desulfosporosinus sp.]